MLTVDRLKRILLCLLILMQLSLCFLAQKQSNLLTSKMFTAYIKLAIHNPQCKYSFLIYSTLLNVNVCLTHSAQGEGLSRSPGSSGRAALEEEFSSDEEAEL